MVVDETPYEQDFAVEPVVSERRTKLKSKLGSIEEPKEEQKIRDEVPKEMSPIQKHLLIFLND